MLLEDYLNLNDIVAFYKNVYKQVYLSINHPDIEKIKMQLNTDGFKNCANREDFPIIELFYDPNSEIFLKNQLYRQARMPKESLKFYNKRYNIKSKGDNFYE